MNHEDSPPIVVVAKQSLAMKCPHCANALDFDAEYIGTETTCPVCEKPIRLYPPEPKATAVEGIIGVLTAIGFVLLYLLSIAVALFVSGAMIVIPVWFFFFVLRGCQWDSH